MMAELPSLELASNSIAEAVRTAIDLYSMLGRRTGVLGTEIFSDPAWNMLLDLLIARSSARGLSVSDVCIGSRAAPTTAHRYLSLLVEQGLVDRKADPDDGRRHYVCLSERGLRGMVELLTAASPEARSS